MGTEQPEICEHVGEIEVDEYLDIDELGNETVNIVVNCADCGELV